MATLNAELAATPAPVFNAQGTPVSTEDQLQDMGERAGDLFSYIRGVTSMSFGGLTPLVSFGVAALALTLSVKVITFSLPFLTAIWGIIRKVVQLILDFIPL